MLYIKYMKKEYTVGGFFERLRAWLERFSKAYLDFCEMVNRRNME
jgi:hypothetical protein